jgi:hypothetical protein
MGALPDVNAQLVDAEASSLEVNRMIPTYRGSFRLVPKNIAP